ncbi:DUF4176 domain-containing protein [Olsenella sp. Marseille-P4559]|uniref:DUF4176 domain-containing protein n=1 Tax=Olsenella sp. Marseille-P4559 TaxID=2364795 RepID=UPI001030C554|nr:DUF4176 domain-containing protein [Olsenella sp. Marseille-P4559]
MECPDFLPLGSVVRVRGSEKPLMVISRAVVVPQGDKRSYYDYGCCLWPEGLMSDAVAYCNHDAVTGVLSKGYSGEGEQAMLKTLGKALATLDIPKGNPTPLGGRG